MFLNDRILAIVFFIAIAIVIVIHALDSRIKHTFELDNRGGKYSIEKLTVAGDFNNWNPQTHSLLDEDGDDIWKIQLPLHKGRHEYRFVLNDEHWLRDPGNREYGGANSNSRVLISQTSYPKITNVFPADGSFLYNKANILKINFSESIASHVSCKLKLLLDGQALSFALIDSVLTAELPDLSEGEHSWKLSITDLKGNEVCSRSGIWLVNYKNQKPLADAGYLQFAVLGQSVKLNGGQSFDPDFEPLSRFEWKLLNGNSSCRIWDTDKAIAGFSAGRSGRYRFRLTVHDSSGAEAKSDGTVIVLNENPQKTTFTFDAGAYRKKVKSVNLVGEFNQWQNGRHILSAKPASDTWEVEMELPKGKYEYKYVVNGQDWIPDPVNPLKIADGWEGFNSIHTVRKNPDFDLVFSGDPNNSNRRTLRINAESSKLKNVKIHWYADVKNPSPYLSVKNRTLYFNKNQKEGSYYYYALLEKNGKFSRPFTLLINHFSETRWYDYRESPKWAKQSVFYEIYLRKFGENNNFEGLEKKLPYLKTLGVNVLWLMPVYEGPTDHGYAPERLFETEADYGSVREYQQFIKKAHQQGFKVIFDFVANHLSDQHRFVKAAAENDRSPFRKWFHWKPDGSWGYHNDWDNLVNLNYETAQVRHFILDVARFWLSAGVDGFRCDVAWAVPHDFWKDFRREVKKANPDCLLLDEVLPRQQSYHDYEFDMSYDTDFYGNVLDVSNARKPLSALDYGLQKTRFNYPAETLDLRYLENHDLLRFLKQFDEKQTRLMSFCLFTIPGVPLIYYGQENGSLEMRPNFNPVSNSKWFDFYKSLIILRQKYAAFTSGEMETISLDDKKKFWHYRRKSASEQFDMYLNLSNSQQKINIAENASIISIGSEGLTISGKEYFLDPKSYCIVRKGR